MAREFGHRFLGEGDNNPSIAGGNDVPYVPQGQVSVVQSLLHGQARRVGTLRPGGDDAVGEHLVAAEKHRLRGGGSYIYPRHDHLLDLRAMIA